MELNVWPESQISIKCKLEKTIVGFFSTDEYGFYQDNVKSLRYLNWEKFLLRKTYIDLKEFSGRVLRTDENNNSFHRYLCSHHEIVYNLPATFFSGMSFICNKKALRCIYNLPYTFECISFMACLYEGKIHLHYCNNAANEELDGNSKQSYNMAPRFRSNEFSWRSSPNPLEYKRFPMQGNQMINQPHRRPNKYDNIGAHVGHKFEQYMLSVHPDIEPVTNEPVLCAEEFNLVNEMKLNNHHILYATEVDGIMIDKNDKQLPVQELTQNNYNEILDDLNTRKFVELKTLEKNLDDPRIPKIKIIETWAQTFFAGADTIVIGVRNHHGIVQSVNKYPSSFLLTLGGSSWDPDICVSFCDTFLNFVKHCFEEEISTFSENLSAIDMKDLKIELFFKKEIGMANIVCETSRRSTYYLHDWIFEGFSEKNKNL